jgi:hypothetical protein
MTLAELDDSLPNGFHDAEITKFVWDFAAESAAFEVILLVGDPDGEDYEAREARRNGTLEVSGIVFVAIDPPFPRGLDPRPYKPSGAFQIDGVVTDEKVFAVLPKLKPELPPDTEIFSFYVINSNSFIHIAAKEANVVWQDSN